MTLKLADLSMIQWEVYHAMRDMDRRGTYPSGDRVCLALEDRAEAAVRRARHQLVTAGVLTIRTPDDRPCLLATRAPAPEPVPDDDGCGDDAAGGGSARPKAVDTNGRTFNLALFRIVEGHPGLYNHLAALTGLTPNALKCRANDVRHSCPPGPDDAPGDDLSPQELRYFEALSRKTSDPAVREWVASMSPSRRRHPDRCRFRGEAAGPN